VEDGKYVIVDPAELEGSAPESSRMIEVHEFVKTGQIDPIFLDRTYYLERISRISREKDFNALVQGSKGTGCRRCLHLGHEKSDPISELCRYAGRRFRLNTLRYATK